jgi:hypothetical protein
MQAIPGFWTVHHPTTERKTMMSKKTEKPKPIHTVDHYPLEASIWENRSKEGQMFHSLTLVRKYKDGDRWKSTGSFNIRDIPRLIRMLDEAAFFVQSLPIDEAR